MTSQATLPETILHAEPAMAEHALVVPAMGGSLTLRVATRAGDMTTDARHAQSLERVARRVGRWSARLTRFDDRSDLSTLNADPARSAVSIRPTLAAALAWGEQATDSYPGLLDVTLLDERLAAGSGLHPAEPPVQLTGVGLRWHLARQPRGGVVHRREPFRFDLDGVAKGWIADRALALLPRYPAAMVDADGDIALRLTDGVAWHIAIADPRGDGQDDLAILRLDGRRPGGLVGVGTSGTSLHRWPADADGSPRHHLLDPRTRRPARTDVVQATVIMASAREAEIMAKAVVIAGSDAAGDLIEGPGVHGAVLLLDSGVIVASPRTVEWLA